jgi:hypothetical protein
MEKEFGKMKGCSGCESEPKKGGKTEKKEEKKETKKGTC